MNTERDSLLDMLFVAFICFCFAVIMFVLYVLNRIEYWAVRLKQGKQVADLMPSLWDEIDGNSDTMF